MTKISIQKFKNYYKLIEITILSMDDKLQIGIEYIFYILQIYFFYILSYSYSYSYS
jgi:hypothetical protein